MGVGRTSILFEGVGPWARVSLENMVPRQFGDWRGEPQRYVQVVNPQAQELMDKL